MVHRLEWLTAVVALCACSQVSGFALLPARAAVASQRAGSRSAAALPFHISSRQVAACSRAAGFALMGKKKAQVDKQEAEEAVSEAAGEEAVVDEEAAPAAEEEQQPDPNAEVKAQIKVAARAAEQHLSAAQESIRERGKTGYVRLAAEVDNYRKRRGADKEALEREAMVRVLRAFEPVMEAFERSGETLALATETEQRFDGNYQALYRQLVDVTAKMGVTDFFGVQGESFNAVRHEKVGEEHASLREGAVLECVSKGTELKGGVIRKAQVVVSKGPEQAPAAEEVPKEGGEEAQE